MTETTNTTSATEGIATEPVVVETTVPAVEAFDFEADMQARGEEFLARGREADEKWHREVSAELDAMDKAAKARIERDFAAIAERQGIPYDAKNNKVLGASTK